MIKDFRGRLVALQERPEALLGRARRATVVWDAAGNAGVAWLVETRMGLSIVAHGALEKWHGGEKA